jgi:hypothetical protein
MEETQREAISTAQPRTIKSTNEDSDNSTI